MLKTATYWFYLIRIPKRALWPFTLIVYGILCLLFPNTIFAAGPDKSGVKPQVINLPSGAGSIQGLGESFEPHLNTGTASYAVPLAVPPGTGGHAPTLRLSYEGGNGNGLYGLGWRLELPFVQRQTDKGLPQYSNSDLFVHSSGEELVPLADGSYRFKSESSFTRFRRVGDGWEATERDGTRWLLGESAQSRQVNALGTFSWLPQRLIDTNGNEVRFFYQQEEGQLYLREIRYNMARDVAFGAEPANSGVRIQFEYETRPDPIYDYRSRSLVRTGQRTKAIEVTALGQRVRRYELGYENPDSVSLLTEVRLLGRNLVRFEDDPTQGMPPIRFGYTVANLSQAQNISMGNPPLLKVGNPNIDLVDINGDALPDLIHTDPFNGHRYYLNRGQSQWANEATYPAASPSAYLETPGVQIADADGDGLADLVVKTGESVGAPFFYYPNLGGNTWELNSRVDFNFNPPFTYEDPDVQLVDLDNDRRIDVLRTNDSAYYVYFNSLTGWSASPDRILTPLAYGATLLFSDKRVKLADMNGDRLQDMVFVLDGQIVYFPAKGYGEFDSVVQMQNSPSLGEQSAEALLSDVNGDGLSDLISVDRFNVFVWLNRAATGFGEQILIANPPEYIAGETNLRLADMNGDGATDLLYSTYPADAEDIARYIDFTGGTLPNLLTTIDNGLGRLISLSYRTSTDYYVEEWNAGQQWTQRSPVPVTVVARSTVTDNNSGQVYTTDYAYRNAWYDGKEKTFRGFAIAQETDHRDATAPTRILQMIFDTGKENESRKGMLLQQDVIGEGGSCGGNSSEVAVMAATALVLPLISASQSVASANTIDTDSAAPLECYSRTLNQLATQKLADGSDGRTASFSFIRQTDVLEYETTATARRKQQTFLYDDYGNRTQEFDYGEVAVDGSNPGLGNDEQFTYFTYGVNLTNGIVDRVTEVRQTDLKGNSVSEQRFYYDGDAFIGLPLGEVRQGNLTRQESNLGPLGGNRWVQSQRYHYDGFGNQTARMDANGVLDANNQPDQNGHWTAVAFDSTFHAYPTAETIHLGSGRTLVINAEYDLGLGVITKTSDFNGQNTLFVYDGLARLAAIVRPDDSLTLPSQTFIYRAGSAVSSVTTESRKQSATSNVYRTITYVDGLGRPLQTRSEGENGKVVVKDATTFNLRGGLHEKFLPYYAANAALDYAAIEAGQTKLSFTYDPLQRPVSMINPDHTITRTLYLPLETVRYDEEDVQPSSPHYNTPTTLRYDGRGRLIQVLERNNSEVYTTTYGYDVLDNLISIIDTQGNLKRQRFDWLNRKIVIDDPNRGVKTFIYDDVGNVLETVDAKGQSITYTYDGVNRIRSENFVLTPGDTTPEIVYHYDADLAAEYPDANHTQGRLSWVEDPSGREYLSYDGRGNLAGKIKRILQPGSNIALDFVTLMQYDAMDRLVATTYPDGVTLTYQYNDQALLESIPGYLTNIDYIASDQRDQVLTSDGVTTDHDYDNRLRMATLRAFNAAGTALQAWHYQFDAASNITQIDDLRPDRTLADDDSRLFTLDNLYRLTSVKYAAGAQDRVDYTYDPLGNLTRKTSTLPSENLGEMRYGQAAGPHALTQVGDATWHYDQNGNLIDKPGFTFTWDFRARLTAVSAPNGLLQEHLYDYADERVVKLVKSSQGEKLVIYPDRTAEVRDEQLVKYIFAGETRIAEVRTPFRADRLIRGFAGQSDTGQQVTGFSTSISNSLLVFLPLINRNSQSDVVQGDVVFYHADHLGSASLLINGQGQVVERSSYLPYGADRTPQNNSQVAYRFTGQEQERDIGLYDYGARFYDSLTGRFISPDPLFFHEPEKILLQPQELNLYSYVRNNPINLTDPTGLCSAPANLKSGATGVCIEAFIATERLATSGFDWIGLGDNRGFKGNDPSATNRFQIQMTFDRSSKDPLTYQIRYGRSDVLSKGIGLRGTGTLRVSPYSDRDGSTVVQLSVSAKNGWSWAPGSPKETIDFTMRLRIPSSGNVSIEAGSHDGYPSYGVYSYHGNSKPTTLYQFRETKIQRLAPPNNDVQVPRVQSR